MARPSTSSLRSFASRQRLYAMVVAAAITGVLVGLFVVGFDWLTSDVILDHVFGLPLWAQALAPAAGLFAAAAALRWLANGATQGTADEYIRAYHDRNRRMDLRPVPGRIMASIATLGMGGALGFEGPSIYGGAAIGSLVQRRLSRFFSRADAKALLIAGAAGGVAAIFKAPATGVLFALEVPYQTGVTPRGQVSALVCGATSYLTFVALLGTTPLLRLAPAIGGFRLQELVGAIVVGLLAGLGARAFAIVTNAAKVISHDRPRWQRVVVAGAGLAGLAVLTHHLYSNEALSLGPGYRTFAWVSVPGRALWLIGVLFLIRFAATTFTVGGGGAGGLFIPLVIQGALLGRFTAGVYDGLGLNAHGHLEAASSLFPVLGIAAFLGAGYRTPLSGVMFVAETTGKAVFVVPALIAAAISQLVMGHRSVSLTQAPDRGGVLERRLTLPISSVIRTDGLTVPPDATIAELMWAHIVGNRQRSIPVVDGNRYVGMVGLEEVGEVGRDRWDDTPVSVVMRRELPTGRPEWTIRDALDALEAADVDCLAVTTDDGVFVGELRTSEIMKLDEILGSAD